MRKSTLWMLMLLLWSSIAVGQEKPFVVSSASIFEDMVQHLAGDLVRSEMIVPIGSDPHLYEPTPADANTISKADIILVNGLTFEGWINKLIQNSGTKADVVTITEGITAIGSQDYKGSSDPHAWMDASNGLVYARNIKDALVRRMPEHEAELNARYQKYVQAIKDTDTYILQAIKKIPPQHRMLITSHDAFAYYGQRYGVELNAIMGISTEAEARTSDVMRVSKAIKEAGVPAIFIESTINPKLLKQIAEDTGVKIGGELFADSIGDEDTEANGYLEMLRHNTDVIVKALADGGASTTRHDHANSSEGGSSMLYWVLGAVLLLGALLVLLKYK